jgi:hypothetical protein
MRRVCGNSQAAVRPQFAGSEERGIETDNLEWMFSKTQSTCQECENPRHFVSNGHINS